MFKRKDKKPVTKKDIENMRAEAEARLRELEEQEDALRETPVITAEQESSAKKKPQESPEVPKGSPELPPPFVNSERADEIVKELFENYGVIVGGGLLPTDRDRITVMLLFAIWEELKKLNGGAE